MRVLVTADTAGGVWTYAVELARALGNRGVRTTIAASGPREPDDPGGLDVRWRPYALEWMGDPWDDLAAADEWLLELRDELRPDLVHLNGYAPAPLSWHAPVVVVTHSDVVTWWQAVRGEDPPEEWGRYRQLVQDAFRAADTVVSPTLAHLDAVGRAYDLDSLRCRVVPNGRSPLEPAPKQPYVAAAGRAWDKAKNLDALRRVEPRVPWPVRIADGTLPADELQGLVAPAAVFAAPGLYEPFGLAALEAASAGCALVLGDLPTQRELWHAAALFVDGRDDDALGAALIRLAEDDELRADLAGRARRRSARYTADAMAAGYVDVYRVARSVAA
jgi:glycogen synthase